MIKAIIGLGNSGVEYEQTYHNVGDFVARRLALAADQHGASVKRYPIQGFMNESGIPVREWMKLNNLAAREIVVVHDDSDLPLGDYRLSSGGGSAGHKGIESLVAHLGTSDFRRLRVGVRDPKEVARKKAGDFVLARWRAGDEAQFKRVSDQAFTELAKDFSKPGQG